MIDQIAEQLSRAAASGDDFWRALYALTDTWTAAGVGLDAVEPILRFMEQHPDLDYGTPGAVVHFMESFYGAGYEDRVLASIDRRPTKHTVWMLNRLINGAKQRAERQRLVAKLESVLAHPRADADTVAEATQFLEFQGK